MTVDLIQGDCLEVLKTLPDQSVQCCVTSPPYYGLRDYGVEGQIGLEETPEVYVAKLVAVFREVKRVLKDDGTLWLNLGDSYCNTNGFARAKEQWQRSGRNDAPANDRNLDALHGAGYKTKDLIGIPWMVAFALRADGWWLRSDIIWAKPNPMPESVTDRPTKSHEYIFLLAKSQKYYYDAAAIQEIATGYDGRKDTKYKGGDKDISIGGHERWPKREHKNLLPDGQQPNTFHLSRADGTPDEVYPMRNKRDVWTVNTKSYKGAHFATYPPALIEPCILAGTSEKGECPKCGKAWVRMVEKKTNFEGGSGKAGTAPEDIHGKWDGKQYGKNILLGPVVSSRTIDWQPQCECQADPVPQTVLDPFSGAGTTGLVAIRHNRNYIGIELNPEYVELTKRRFEKIQPVLFEEAK